MGKLSAEQENQLKELERIRDGADDDDEISCWVRNSEGHETRLTGARAVAWMKRNGYDAEDATDSTKTDPLDAKGTPPAKKAAPGKAGDPPEDPPAQDPPAGGAPKPRKFF